MAPGRYTLEVYRGDTGRWAFVLWEDSAKTVPVDLTGATAAAEIYEDGTATALSCTVAGNTITAVLSSALSAALAMRFARWDLQVTYGSGDVQTILTGPVKVLADVVGGAA